MTITPVLLAASCCVFEGPWAQAVLLCLSQASGWASRLCLQCQVLASREHKTLLPSPPSSSFPGLRIALPGKAGRISQGEMQSQGQETMSGNGDLNWSVKTLVQIFTRAKIHQWRCWETLLRRSAALWQTGPLNAGNIQDCPPHRLKIPSAFHLQWPTGHLCVCGCHSNFGALVCYPQPFPSPAGPVGPRRLLTWRRSLKPSLWMIFLWLF